MRNVDRAKSGANGSLDSVFDGCGRFFQIEAIAQHESGAEDLGAGVGEVFARDVGGGAACGFVETKGVSVSVFPDPKAG